MRTLTLFKKTSMFAAGVFASSLGFASDLTGVWNCSTEMSAQGQTMTMNGTMDIDVAKGFENVAFTMTMAQDAMPTMKLELMVDLDAEITFVDSVLTSKVSKVNSIALGPNNTMPIPQEALGQFEANFVGGEASDSKISFIDNDNITITEDGDAGEVTSNCSRV